MATIHVRNFPDALHRRLRRRASVRGRSLSAELVDIVAETMRAEDVQQSQGAILAEIHRRRLRRKASTVSSLELLRKDRAR